MNQDAFPLPGGAGRRLVQTILEPLHGPVSWSTRRARRGEAHFPGGLALNGGIDGEEALLQTAYDHFGCFFHDCVGDPRSCVLVRARSLDREEHEIRVFADRVEIHAGDADGIRRALVWIEDEMLKRRGRFLPMGTVRRKAVIRTRISRCFFGPINRPPLNRDELAEDTNFYPEPYLNRLAHDGVNALWITIRFRDTVPSRLFPGFAPDAEPRLARLREAVERCGRYGIRIFVFCIEPDSFPLDSPILKTHPELRGHVIETRAAFCTGSKLGKSYLSEAARTLFQKVPGLGGMIVIPVGERFTQCSSISLPEGGMTSERCNCPRCSRRSPHRVLHDTLEALRKGMHGVDPAAELIAWPYGQLMMWGEKMTVESASHIPRGVILQHNFETGGTNRQLGKDRPLCDYWLSVIGPSPVFRKAAESASRRGNRIAAKLQVGCSHEDATVPFVPVPGLLHAKYSQLARLGVSAVMQSWYFGNYPSLMTRAAGLLSFAPFPKRESDFLEDLAVLEWGRQAKRVASAWMLFRKAYEHYPSTHLFGYYGPVQDGVVWPLHLIPKNRPLAPSWKIDYPVSGDFLADCLSSEFTLEEVVKLCEQMARGWRRGLTVFMRAVEASEGTQAQRREWLVASAIAVQFDSAAGILRFYKMREQLTGAKGAKARAVLTRMRTIVRQEIDRRHQMIALCRKEPTLGFHPEAEGFKFTPALIRRGIRSLERLLAKEFSSVERAIQRGDRLFGAYDGSTARALCVSCEETGWMPLQHGLEYRPSFPEPGWKRLPIGELPGGASFRICARSRHLEITIDGNVANSGPKDRNRTPWNQSVVIDIEPRRLHPRVQFLGDSLGTRSALIDDGYLMKQPLPFQCRWTLAGGRWTAVFRIPMQSARLRPHGGRFRFNVRTVALNPDTGHKREFSWSKRRPLKPRQAWEDANPASDYLWAELR